MIRIGAIICLAFASIASAQVLLTFPTRGYFRIGKYLPVAIATPAAKEIRVTGQGLLPLRIEAANSPVNATFPLLVIASPGNTINVAVDGVAHPISLSLHPLTDDERLVAIDDIDPSFAKNLFPGRSIVTAPIDPSQLSAGDAMTWDALDGIASASAPESSNERSVWQALLAGGAALAVRADHPPFAAWPWEKRGAMWIVHRDAPGFSSAVDARAYEPVMNWRPGAPSATRIRAMGIGVLAVIAILAASLLRGRKQIAAIVVVAIASTAAVLIWAAAQPPVRRALGEIEASDAHFRQMDLWSYVTTDRDSPATIDVPAGFTRPMLFSAEQVARLNLTLVCDASGKPLSFEMHLPADAKFAMMSRMLGQPVPAPVSSAIDSPMRSLAADVYAVDGYRIIGQGPALRDAQRWPAIFLRQSAPPATP